MQTLQITPIMALNLILDIAPVDIPGSCIGAKVTYRLREAAYIKGSKQGHSEILSSFNRILENFDHCVAEAIPGSGFSIHIISRNMWIRGRGAVSFFKDGWKLNSSVRSSSSSIALAYRTTVLFFRLKWFF